MLSGDLTPISQYGKRVYLVPDRNKALLTAKKMYVNNNENNHVHSTLISGECWDTTLSWITSTADSNYATNCDKTKGNYIYQVETGGGYDNRITGQYATNTNNIYDLGGNVAEFTTECCTRKYYDDIRRQYTSKCYVIRGDVCGDSAYRS